MPNDLMADPVVYEYAVTPDNVIKLSRSPPPLLYLVLEKEDHALHGVPHMSLVALL